MLYDLLIGSFSKASLAAFSASSYVLYPSCASGVISPACAFKISFFNASTPSTVLALLIRLKKNWDVTPASFNSLIASSLAFFNNHSSIVIPGFDASWDFNNSSFKALTPSIVFAFLIWFKNKSEVTPAAFNSLIASSLAFFKFHSSIVIPGFSPVFSSSFSLFSLNGCSSGLNQLSEVPFSSSNSLFSVSNLGFAWSSKSGYSNIGFPESSTFSGIPSSAA